MYQYSEIKTVHLEITSRCQASCPMCIRNINGGVDNPWLKIDEITLEQFKQWFPIPFVQQLERLYMCGNTGDPIVAKDTLEIFKYLREHNPSIQLSMNTNGSAKTKDWWIELATVRVKVRFGIDGLEDTHSLYRIGTDWHKIMNNASAFINNGGEAVWDMLVFEHNEHQVLACEELSQQLGFKEFIVKHTSRFKEGKLSVLDKEGKTSHILWPSSKSKDFTKKFLEYKIEENKEITCKVQQEKSLYVNAHGEVSPCCWLDFQASPPMNPDLVDFKDKKFYNLSLKDFSLEEVFNKKYFDQIEDTWTTCPLRKCSKECGKIDKFKEQFYDSGRD